MTYPKNPYERKAAQTFLFYVLCVIAGVMIGISFSGCTKSIPLHRVTLTLESDVPQEVFVMIYISGDIKGKREKVMLPNTFYMDVQLNQSVSYRIEKASYPYRWKSQCQNQAPDSGESDESGFMNVTLTPCKLICP